VKLLQSRNKFVSSIAELMGKKINGLISPIATHGARKTTMDVMVSNNKLDRSIKNGWVL
jgi:hypothetical protein